MASRRTREKRLARRIGTHVTERPPLVRHTSRCPCTGCEQRRAKGLKRATALRDKRRHAYAAQHPDPEHRDGWRISGEKLADYMATHAVERYRNKITAMDMRPEWISHLDGLVDGHALNAGLLYSALIVLEGLHPLRGQLVCERCIGGITQVELAQRLCISESAVSRNLEAGLDLLLHIYGQLVLAEQLAAVAAS